MVKFSFISKTIKIVVCALVMSAATNVSAQNVLSDLKGTVTKGVSNLFKKKDKSEKQKKDKSTKESNVSTAKSTKNIKKAEDDVELVVTGDGYTKEQATLSALRSALEQAYGTFVSSNTKILNDELVKDEIVSVSKGNIKAYKYITETKINGKNYVTLRAIVSIGKLTQYVKSKGGEAELAGATFAMNLKLKRLRSANLIEACDNLNEQISLIRTQYNLYDYEIIPYEPEVYGSGIIQVPFIIGCIANENRKQIAHLIQLFNQDVQNSLVGNNGGNIEDEEIAALVKMAKSRTHFVLNVEDVLKFKIIDDIAEYPFYVYDVPMSSSAYTGHGYYFTKGYSENRNVRVESPCRMIDRFMFSEGDWDGYGYQPIYKIPIDKLGHEGNLYCEGLKTINSSDTYWMSPPFHNIPKTADFSKYSILICGTLYYTEKEIEKVSKIRIEPVLELKKGEFIECKKTYHGNYRNHYEETNYNAYDDEVDCLKRGRQVKRALPKEIEEKMKQSK